MSTTTEMILPEGMNFNVKQSLSSKFNVAELTFKTILIKNLKDENNQVVPELIQPRYLHVYSENGAEVREAIFNIKKVLGDAFDYEVSEGDDLPLSETKVSDVPNKISLLGHYRSRCLYAKQINEDFSKMKIDQCFSVLLKSTYAVNVSETVSNGTTSYMAVGTFMPRTADLLINSGILSYPSPVIALEKLLKNEITPYNRIIDLNFDTVAIVFKEFRGEFEPPENADEFITFFTKNILAHAMLGKEKVL